LHCSKWDPDAFEWTNFQPETRLFRPELFIKVQQLNPGSHLNWKAPLQLGLYKAIQAYNPSHIKE
jgi:hypothetical protein